jgi:hypothetical protein
MCQRLGFQKNSHKIQKKKIVGKFSEKEFYLPIIRTAKGYATNLLPQ